MAAPTNQPPVSRRLKRKRRRRQDKPAVFARLVLDEHVKGDVGIVSEDLFQELFPNRPDEDGAAQPDHIAIAPKRPFQSVDEISWTVVPVRPSSALATNTIQFSPSSLALQGFAEELQRTAPSKLMSHSRSGIEIWALDVLPLTLDTVFITLEADLAKRLENGEGTFHSDHPSNQLAKARSNGASEGSGEERLTTALREALASLHVVHTGDFVALPLAPHPVTHMPPPPAKITLCEPVAQGLLTKDTKIIVTRTGHQSRTVRKSSSIALDRALHKVAELDEDTSTEQYLTAVEDKESTDTVDETETEGEGGDHEDEDDLSDDSMDEIISLQAPTLPSSRDMMSGIATPYGGLGGRKTNGFQTPGSVYSSYTATTAKTGGQRGRLFQAKGLMRALPEELLRPTPGPEYDEESRIYVDVNSLAKIGCFSGDWVRLETAQEPPEQGMGGLWSLGNFGQQQEDDFIWRPVRVYSLPEGYSQRPVTKISHSNSKGRSMSFFDSQVLKPSSPTVYLSPVLLANLESPPYVRLSTLKHTSPMPGKPQVPKILSSSLPPLAREVTFVKISTPLATERMLQTAALSGLKMHFATRTRVVKQGDIVGITIDETLGRTLFQTSSTPDSITDDVLVNPDQQGAELAKATGVVWFKVGHITHAKQEEVEDAEEEDIWGGVASIDMSRTQMAAAGSEKGRLPPTKDNTWEYYLRLKNVSKSSSDSIGNALPEPHPPVVTPLRRRLRELIAAATSPRSIHLKLPPLAILLVSTQRNIGKATVAAAACSDIGLHSFAIDAYDIVSEGGAGGDVKTEGFLKARAERALTCGPENTALVIRHIEALTAERMITALKEILADSRVIIATTTEVDKVPDGVRALFTHELDMNAPDEGEREGVLRDIIDNLGASLDPAVDLGSVAVKTAALVAGDLVDVVERALVARASRLQDLAAATTSSATADEPSLITVRDVQISGGPAGRSLTKSDFDIAVEHARKNFADAIGAPKIPNVTWDDVGGLSNVKDAVMETIQLPLERPELFAKGMKKRSGILFYGPPGTGKTLLAKAIATEFSLNFFSVKGPELLNMYIGESEANVRRVFQRARDARPCVVFFDELDSVAPKRGNQGDSGGVMDRIVSQLLAELDGMSDGDEGGGGVFVIGATNRPDLLDAALLRPGRFDKMLYLGVSDTHEKQATIMEALTRKFTLSPSLSLRRIAEHLPFTYSGADFYALCSDAMLKAVTRQASAVDAKIALLNSQTSHLSITDSDSKDAGASAASNSLEKAQQDPTRPEKVTPAYFFDHYAMDEDIAVQVTEEDFMAAQRELIPSISAKELEHYQRVRAQFESVGEKEAREAAASAQNGGGRILGEVGGEVGGAGEVVDRKGKGKARELLNGLRQKVNGTRGSKGKGKMIDDEDEGYEAGSNGIPGGFGSAADDDDLY